MTGQKIRQPMTDHLVPVQSAWQLKRATFSYRVDIAVSALSAQTRSATTTRRTDAPPVDLHHKEYLLRSTCSVRVIFISLKMFKKNP